VPRRKTVVKDYSKNKSRRLAQKIATTPGSVDLHFHGAFGIDLMTAAPAAMNELGERLWQAGVSSFCPTTLSAPPEELADAISRIGPWIKSQWNLKQSAGALPLGIHLEGPFIHPESRGAHPLEAVRPVDLSELERLWELSQNTLKILTVAPEHGGDLKALTAWCRKRKIILSLGHSKATEEQAAAAFDAGFSGITHAWNALPFHHRAPGPLGAALGRKNIHVELIIDQVHVAPTLLRWTQSLHGREPLCYVSDCVPAAATAKPDETGPWTPFGSLEIRQERGACRLSDGSLAGGGLLLPQMIGRYLETEALATGQPLSKLLKTHARHWSKDPIRALRLPATLQKRACLGRVEWHLEQERLTAKR
jgi:N-acetylglucosamine-6-phosphate deacetylase